MNDINWLNEFKALLLLFDLTNPVLKIGYAINLNIFLRAYSV